MKSSVLTINQGHYFPLPFRVIGGLLPLFAVFFLIRENYILASSGLLMAFLLLTTKYELVIDFSNKIYEEHLKILGFKRGDKIQYDTIEKAVIAQRNKSSTYNSRGSTTTIKTAVYYLLLIIDEERIEVVESEKKEKVMLMLNRIKEHIKGLETEDFSKD